MGAVIIGVDIGQKHDPTAIAVAEPQWRTVEKRAVDHHVIRHLERLPLGTPYPAVVSRIQAVVQGVRTQGAVASTLYVDATGVGQPVVDLLAHVGVRVRAVYFTHGDRRTVSEDGSTISLGKAWLVSRLQALLQTGRILLPETAEARQLARELIEYEIRVDEDANDKYGAFRVGTHDDMVTALGLAVQEGGGRVFSSAVAGGHRNVILNPTRADIERLTRPPHPGRWRPY